MSQPPAVYGIIGFPVEHSLSPVMHNTAFKELSVDAVYKLFPLKENELEGFFNELRRKDNPIFGLNVTVPYKEKVIPFLNNLNPLAQKIMAVNTVVITKKRELVGFNTDAPGIMAHLTELGVKTENKKIAILGAGGSARAILTVLCLIPERPLWIKVYNRSLSRLDDLLADLNTRLDISIVEPVMGVDDLGMEEADILINTTSIGLKKDDVPLVDESLIHPGLFVYDLIYQPSETMLLKMARGRGAKTSNGLGMLYYQGVLAFQHWAGIQLSEKVKKKMRESLERGVKT